MGISRTTRTRWPLAAVTAVLVAAGAVTVSGTAFGAGAQATASVSSGTYTLTVTKSGMCMDVTGGSTASGTLIQQWGCGASQSNQQWVLTDTGSGQYTIKSVLSGMCLDVPGASKTSGVQLQQYTCGAGKTNQLWTLTAVGSTYQIVNVNSGLCVSDSGASTTAGTAIIQETCSTNTNKTWTLGSAGITGTVCKPSSYGAKGDGVTKDTAALQAAINACAGKGTVELTAGKYLSGALTLAANMTFTIDSGATLLASQTASDYGTGSSLAPLLGATNADNLTINGAGTIDGQGAPWWAAIKAEKAAGQSLEPRPCLITINTATNVHLTGITLKNAPNVHITFKKITTGVVDHITVSSPSDSPNTDGIDVWSSSGVAVTNSTFDDGDDDIAIDSSSDGPAHDISLSGCTILHGHGLSIGSYTAGGVYNINIHDDTLNGTTAGVRLKTARGRGGEVHAITYQNLTMTNVANPIQITEYYPSVPADGDPAQPITSTTPYYHDITVSNVTATGATTTGEIIGLPERPITGMTLTSVKISAKTGMTVRNATVSTSGTTITPSSGSAYILQSKATVN